MVIDFNNLDVSVFFAEDFLDDSLIFIVDGIVILAFGLFFNFS